MAKSAERAHDPVTFPPEWAPHTAVWSAWPRLARYWSGAIEGARREMAAFFRAIADPDPASRAPRGETVRVLVRGKATTTGAREALSAPGIELVTGRYGDVWLRDTAPIFVQTGEGKLRAVGFEYNGWGGKYIMSGDESAARAVARAARIPFAREDWVLEGGSLDTDGEGTALTTRECLLNPNRNPGLDEKAIARRLHETLGIEKLIWLDEGLLNDHTDGHIDNLARFVAPQTVVCMAPSGPSDPNARVYRAVRKALERARDARDRRLTVIPVPSPGLVTDANGELMPASHMNFYISNTRVIVPVYGTDFDEAALEALRPLFPGREIIGLRANHILVGGGSFHCITQQQPPFPHSS